MKVEQPILSVNPDNPSQVTISSRIKLDCEVLETLGDGRLRVRILEAGAGLAVDDEITVPAAKVTET